MVICYRSFIGRNEAPSNLLPLHHTDLQRDREVVTRIERSANSKEHKVRASSGRRPSFDLRNRRKRQHCSLVWLPVDKMNCYNDVGVCNNNREAKHEQNEANKDALEWDDIAIARGDGSVLNWSIAFCRWTLPTNDVRRFRPAFRSPRDSNSARTPTQAYVVRACIRRCFHDGSASRRVDGSFERE